MWVKKPPASEVVESPPKVATDSNYGYQKDFRTALPQLIAVSVKNLLLLGYGMTLGFPTILIPAVSNPIGNDPERNETLHLQDSEVSWIGSINLIVVPLGCALSGVITSPLGRRRSMQLVNIPFFIAWLLFHFSDSIDVLYVALCLTGLAGGLLEAPVLTYVAEVTQPHLRGALTATSSMCIILGVFTQFLFGIFYYWRTVALINIIFTVMALIALCFVPESPHWLVSRNRIEDARASLQWLRGWTSSNSVESELNDIQAIFNKNNEKSDSTEPRETLKEQLGHYTKKSFLVPYFLVSYAFFVGHFCGMTTLQTYAVKIFQTLETPIDKNYATLILGIVQIAGTVVCVLLVHYTGKRPLTFISTAGAGICCMVVAALDLNLHGNEIFSTETIPVNITNTTSESLHSEGSPHPWIPMVFLMLLAGFSHIGIRLLPWILIGEVFSARTRSGAAGLSSAIGYIFGFLTNKIFLSMVNSMSIWGTYGLYGIISLSGTIVFYFILPETEGKKLIEIENHFAGKMRLTNQVYRSKRPSITRKKSATSKDIQGAANPTFEVSTEL